MIIINFFYLVLFVGTELFSSCFLNLSSLVQFSFQLKRFVRVSLLCATRLCVLRLVFSKFTNFYSQYTLLSKLFPIFGIDEMKTLPAANSARTTINSSLYADTRMFMNNMSRRRGVEMPEVERKSLFDILFAVSSTTFLNPSLLSAGYILQPIPISFHSSPFQHPLLISNVF